MNSSGHRSKMFHIILVAASIILALCEKSTALPNNFPTSDRGYSPSINYTASIDQDAIAATADSLNMIYENSQGNSTLSRRKRAIGRTPMNKNYVTIFGTPVNEYAYSYIVSLRARGSHTCGGTVITPQLILTAAHCIDQSVTQSPITSVLVFGLNGATSYPVANRIPHAQYESDQVGIHDLGVIVLGRRIINAQTVTVSSQTQMITGNAEAQAFGWGLDEYGRLSDQLKMVQLPMIHPSICQRQYGAAGQWICIGTSRRNVCNGDSGGPLMYNNQQIGITSFVGGSFQGNPCMSGMPTVFTRVSSYYNWIQYYARYFP